MRVFWVSDMVAHSVRPNVFFPIVKKLPTPYTAIWTAPSPVDGPQLFVGIGDFTEAQLDFLDDYAENNNIDWMYIGMDADDDVEIPAANRGKLNQILAANGIPPASVGAQAAATLTALSKSIDFGRDFELMKAEFAVNHGRDWR